jgi:hypothetical protein
MDASVMDPPWGRVKIVMRLNAPERATALDISARIFTGTGCLRVIVLADTGCSDVSVVFAMPLFVLQRWLING